MKTLLKFAVIGTALLLPLTAVSEHKTPKITSVDCLAANLFFEARGESVQGMKAVAKVTLNRVNSKKYPSNICSVVFQRKQFSWTHQQTWVRIDKVLRGSVSNFKMQDRKAYDKAQKIAQSALKNGLNVLPDDSLHYHATHVNPKWSKKMRKYATIGNHTFYRS